MGAMGGIGGMGGPGGMGGLLDHIHTGMGSMSSPFGSHIMGVFGGQGPRKSWWEKENVCKQTDVEEEEEEKKEEGGNFSFQMEVHSCSEEEDRYVCTHKSGSQAGLTTVKTIYKCCHGFRLVSRDSCVAVEEMKPLEETLEELGGGQFLDLLVKNDLARQLVNMTVFMPTDEAVEEWLKEMEGLDQPQGYTVYRVDDGLLGKRKKRSITLFDEPQPQEVLAGHLTPGFLSTSQFCDESLLQSVSLQASNIRITKYSTTPVTVMANCAKITSGDNQASNGVVHKVDRVLKPAQDNILDILEADSQFNLFVDALKKHGLHERLSEQSGHLTVLAPTDEAFEAMGKTKMDEVLGGLGCSHDILKAHIIDNVICSGAVQGTVTIKNSLGHTLQMERDSEGNVLVDGISLMLTDKIATNGVIHVVESVVMPPSAHTVMEAVRASHAPHLEALLDAAEIEDILAKHNNVTLFLPSERALTQLGSEARANLLTDRKALQDILLHHVGLGAGAGEDGFMQTAGGTKLRLTRDGPQCARLKGLGSKVCGGVVYPIDRLLTPPKGSLLDTLAREHSQFASLISVAKLEEELSSGHYTVLAPLDEAFEKLDTETREKIFSDSSLASTLVKSHLIRGTTCCASIPMISRLRKRSGVETWISLRRNSRGHLSADNSPILRCDVAAENGVVHSVSRLLGMGDAPRSIQWSDFF